MKVSILTPTYNDSNTIVETLNSVKSQTFEDWEMLIMDDGSTDNTKEIIENYIKTNKLENQIRYYYQDNADQLNAINNLIDKSSGEYIFVLHSDDLFYDSTSLQKCVEYMEKNKEIDAIICDLCKINEQSENIGILKVNSYIKSKRSLAIMQLLNGRNIYVDVNFSRRESYLKNNRNTYIHWNMPFWTGNYSFNEKILNVKKVNFIYMKYRIHEANYINNEKGKLNVMNGMLRNITYTMKLIDIPFFRFQQLVAKVFNKLGILKIYFPIYLKKEQKNKDKIVENTIKVRFSEGYRKNIFFDSLIGFFENNTNRTIRLDSKLLEKYLYMGKDMRRFNTDLINDELPDEYIKFMNEMKKGFKTIVVKNNEELEKANIITKFFCIYPYINIELESI